jgi:hypothetical protein
MRRGLVVLFFSCLRELEFSFKTKLATVTISTPNGCMQKTANKPIQRSVRISTTGGWRYSNGSCREDAIDLPFCHALRHEYTQTFLLLCSNFFSWILAWVRLTHTFTVPLKNGKDEDYSRHGHDERNQCKLGALVTQTNLSCARLASNPFLFSLSAYLSGGA